MAEALSYCAAEVRRVDYDRFLAALFAPPHAREGLFALYAFNHEVAKVRETVSEPMLGQIRLQWWRETVAALYEHQVRAHPVARALGEAMQAARARGGGLTRAHFDRLIDAREFDLTNRAPASLAELEAYGEGTSSTLLWLAADLLGAKGEAAGKALRALGVAWAITGLIRAIPVHARARRQYIPADLAAEAGLSQSTLFALEPGPALRESAARMAAAAERHLDAARAAAPELDRAARPLLPLAAIARGYLAQLARRGYDVTGRVIDLPRAAKVARLWWTARTGRF